MAIWLNIYDGWNGRSGSHIWSPGGLSCPWTKPKKVSLSVSLSSFQLLAIDIFYLSKQYYADNTLLCCFSLRFDPVGSEFLPFIESHGRMPILAYQLKLIHDGLNLPRLSCMDKVNGRAKMTYVMITNLKVQIWCKKDPE